MPNLVGPRQPSVFITVGTTKFPKLIETVTSDEIIKILKSCGFGKVVLQYGQGEPPVIPENTGVEWELFALKTSIADDIAAACLVISHAGAGSVIETLRCGKPLIVVINEDLMENHQEELAEAMQKKQYLLSCTCRTLKENLLLVGSTKFLSFPEHCPEMFTSYLNKAMGVF